MDINNKQNSSLNLKRLAAQRELYSDAKKIQLGQYLISGLALVFLGVMGNLFAEKHIIYITLSSIILLLIDELFLSRKKEGLTHLAAAIQEEFDCEVLGIPRNEMKEDSHSLLEIIQKKNKQYIKKYNNYKDLENWYPGVKGIELKIGRVICMSTNCWWNQELRKRYSFFLKIISSFFVITLLIIALIQGITVNSFIGSVLAPLLPGSVLIYKTVEENNKSIQNLNHMKKKLEGIIKQLKYDLYQETQLNIDIRLLQDMIYENRANSPLIPEKFYFYYRNNDEVTAKDTNEETINQINNIIKK